MWNVLYLISSYYVCRSFGYESREIEQYSPANMDELLARDCIVDTELPNTPLMVQRDTPFVYYPKFGTNRYLQFFPGEKVEFHCPGNSVILKGEDLSLEYIFGVCLPNEKSAESQNKYLSKEIKCKDLIWKSVIHELESDREEEGEKYYQVAFSIRDYLDTFVYKFSFNHDLETPVFTYYRSLPMRPEWLETGGKKLDSPMISDPGFYNVSIDIPTLYDVDVQIKTFNMLLDSTRRNVYVRYDNHLIMIQLVPAMDFFYMSTIISTRRYINTVPQWMSVNKGNWQLVEDKVRKFTQYRGKNLKVWTGVYGTLALPKENGKLEDIYLYVNNSERKIPVPALFWKVLYSKPLDASIAIITLNNIFVSLADIEEYVICEDVSDEVGWLARSKTEIRKGFSYACAVEDLKKVIDEVPNFENSTLLIFF